MGGRRARSTRLAAWWAYAAGARSSCGVPRGARHMEPNGRQLVAESLRQRSDGGPAGFVLLRVRDRIFQVQDDHVASKAPRLFNCPAIGRRQEKERTCM